MKKTKIDWADYVWNPVTGCTKVSAGCKNCYAERHANRFWGERKFTDVICHEDRLDQPLHIKKPGRVFVNSMSDLFHPDVPDDFILGVFIAIYKNPKHTYIILTKRPERMLSRVKELEKYFPIEYLPIKYLWLGVSVEDQKTADERIPILLQTPAAVRFVSYEPALGEVDISKYLITKFYNKGPEYSPITVKSIDWVIMGCESGPYRRPMDIDWARSMRTQCQAANVPFFLKQMDVAGKVVKMPELDGKVWDQYPEAKVS
jgi:protein gp37